ncbi:hypothetical protein ARALYDRAFT_891521 [Arabidopsis lyrata subsp. lyrata]|uniref:Uncharacterized protein n=1 Tax=Arabidopsis lyrata subsp. lyrata TaxID=81972 RepID=D7KAS7_ARALL|nr:hypothetical protein ARALYDRAFT_904955 [Arabidopsis lyrata subsp. lyrata]EFH70307.1 hypothetical protein ARALYDRAFT_891521 [Arabidopsis lyrata subsp. lyrata]
MASENHDEVMLHPVHNPAKAVMMGNTSNEIPTLESASMEIRVLPLPNMIDKQMSSLLEE